jgi:hypothetical protein
MKAVATTSLAAAVITIDAMHTQSDTAQVILGRGADYVMTVKGNMPTLYRQLKKLLRAAVPAALAASMGHGRRAQRTIKTALFPAWIEVAGAAQVARLRRTVTRKGRKTVDVVCLITSGAAADPAPWPPGSAATGRSRTNPTGSATSLPGRQIPGRHAARTR